MSSTSGNQDRFWVYYTGGEGDTCQGKVRFQLSFAGSEGTFQRAFTLATTALVSGRKIHIYSYTDTLDCDSAVSMEMLR